MSSSALYGFSRSDRLLDANDYAQVFKKGVRNNTPFFLIIMHRNNFHQARLGISISKKKIKKATKRNRIKRIIREAFRYNKNELQGMDIIVLPHGYAQHVETENLRIAFIDQIKLLPTKL